MTSNQLRNWKSREELQFSSNICQGFFRGNHHGKGCGPKTSINRTSYLASSSPSSFTCTVADWIGCTTSSPLCLTIAHWLAPSSWVLLFLPGSSNVWKKCSCDSRNWHMADNVDHNLRTLDGNDTFHGMGLIVTVTPGTKQTQVILWRKVNPTEVLACGQIQIQYQRLDGNAEVKFRYQDVCIRKATDPTTNLDVLWKTSPYSYS